nr:AAA family ATPase [candidate division Zixibacteria bacterium]
MNNERRREFVKPGEIVDTRPTVVSFISGKGGTGKTVLAYNLVVIMAGMGYRCLLLDGDWYFGDVHILANVSPLYTLSDLIKGKVDVSEAVFRINSGLDLLASPSCGATVGDIRPADFDKLFTDFPKLFGDYEFILIDTPSGGVEMVSRVASMADINLIVINPEWSSIADGYGLFKYLISRNKDFLAYIFLNKVRGQEDYEYIYQKFTVLSERFLNRIPLGAGYLFDDQHVVDSVAKQKPIVEIYPGATAVEKLNRLSGLLVEVRKTELNRRKIMGQQDINSKKLLADIRK